MPHKEPAFVLVACVCPVPVLITSSHYISSKPYDPDINGGGDFLKV